MQVDHICKLFCLAIVSCGIIVSTADARSRGRRHHRGYRASSSSQSVLARMYAEQLRAAAIRDAAVGAARAESNRASMALYLLQSRLKRDYKLTDGAQTAATRLRLAQQELEAAHESVIVELAKTPEYAAAVKSKQAAIAQVEAMKEFGSNTPQWLTVVAAKTAAASLVSRLELAAFKNNETVQSAVRRVDAALAEVKADRRRYETGVRGDTGVAAASADLVEARKQLARAYAAGNGNLANTGRGRPNSRSTRSSR